MVIFLINSFYFIVAQNLYSTQCFLTKNVLIDRYLLEFVNGNDLGIQTYNFFESICLCACLFKSKEENFQKDFKSCFLNLLPSFEKLLPSPDRSGIPLEMKAYFFLEFRSDQRKLTEIP